MIKYERWNEMTPEKKFQAARWEANAETNNATTKQDFKNIVKYLVKLIENDECPSCHGDNNQPWINVKDRLPDVEVNVLILQNYRESEPYSNITIGHLHQDKDLRRKPYWHWIAYGGDMVNPKIESYHRADFICPGSEFVTHWMPLPELPKE